MCCRSWSDASVNVDVNFGVVGGFSSTVEVRDPESEITREKHLLPFKKNIYIYKKTLKYKKVFRLAFRALRIRHRGSVMVVSIFRKPCTIFCFFESVDSFCFLPKNRN